MKPLYYRVIQNGYCRLAGTTSEVEKLTGYKILDPENYGGGQLEDGTIIHPVFSLQHRPITAIDRAKPLKYLI